MGLAWLVALAGPTSAQTAVVVGMETRGAVDFQALRLDGTAFDSEALRGKTVLLDFWGTWCPPCVAAFPKLSALHERLADRDFLVLGLAFESGTVEEVSDFLSEHRVTYPVVVVDETVVDAFAIDYFPTYVLVGPDGGLIEKYEGQQTDLGRRVERRLGTDR